jgi:hypothetical protein
LFELIDASGLEFIGFSNPHYWEIERLLGKNPQLIERVAQLSDRQRYRLIELLDPELTHYEFFLGRPPLHKVDWSSDEVLLAAIPERNPCMNGWPSQSLFDYDYQLVKLSAAEFEFIQACEANSTTPTTVGEILSTVELGLGGVRSLQQRQLIMLCTSPN